MTRRIEILRRGGGSKHHHKARYVHSGTCSTPAPGARARRRGIAVVRPFATPNVLLFFRGFEMNLLDVIRSKRFLYRFLEELLGAKTYRDLYKADTGKQLPAPKTETWQKLFIRETSIGRALLDAAGAVLNVPEYLLASGKIQDLESLYWYKRIMDTCNEPVSTPDTCAA